MASQRSERARRFLELFRHSQMYEVFITERLKLAAEGYESPGALQDAFEQKVTALQNRMTGKKLGKTLVTASAKSVSNLTSIIRNAGQSVRVSHVPSFIPAVQHFLTLQGSLNTDEAKLLEFQQTVGLSEADLCSEAAAASASSKAPGWMTVCAKQHVGV